MDRTNSLPIKNVVSSNKELHRRSEGNIKEEGNSMHSGRFYTSLYQMLWLLQ